MPFKGTETVLIVDDDDYIRSVAEMTLVPFGYTVLTASSGHEAISLMVMQPELKIDVAVIDIVMPAMDGFELVEQLLKFRPGLPVLYMSAYPDRPDMRPIDARSTPFISKPFTTLTFAGKIRGVLDALPAL